MKKNENFLWNEELYELIEFLFWEPQHIGKKKKINSKYENWNDVIAHLEKIEVLLNHHFSLFFNLISYKQKQSILSNLLKISLDDDFEISSMRTRNLETIIDNFTQPDLLFEGRENVVYVEMKIGAKSNCAQLLKYLILHILYEEKTKTSKNPYLLFIGVGNLQNFFTEKIETIEALKVLLYEYEIPPRKRINNIDIREYRVRALRLLETIDIAFVNYDDLGQVLCKELDKTKNETEQKLFGGLLAELKKRNLISIK
jgi:hypothetical protein